MALGISIYPKHSTYEEMITYIDLAYKYGFTKIFTCLLSLDDEEKQLSEIEKMIKYARNKNFDVLLDLSPQVFDQLGIEYGDLKFFNDMGATAIRLDEAFDSKTEALMTYNEYGIEINLNISNDTHYIDTIMDYMPNTDKLTGSHNFYPFIKSGLSEEHFIKTSNNFNKYSLNTAAFINSNVAEIGSEYSEFGLCTLEMHRGQSVKSQVKYFKYGKLINDIYIANMFASEEELKQIQSEYNNDNVITLSCDYLDKTELNRNIIDELHFYRGDVNGSFIRSTMPRVKYKGKVTTPSNLVKSLKKGDIVIVNNNIDHYQNELQLILNDFDVEHEGYNLVAKVKDEDLSLIKFIKPWSKFKLELEN